MCNSKLRHFDSFSLIISIIKDYFNEKYQKIFTSQKQRKTYHNIKKKKIYNPKVMRKNWKNFEKYIAKKMNIQIKSYSVKNFRNFFFSYLFIFYKKKKTN